MKLIKARSKVLGQCGRHLGRGVECECSSANKRVGWWRKLMEMRVGQSVMTGGEVGNILGQLKWFTGDRRSIDF